MIVAGVGQGGEVAKGRGRGVAVDWREELEVLLGVGY